MKPLKPNSENKKKDYLSQSRQERKKQWDTDSHRSPQNQLLAQNMRRRYQQENQASFLFLLLPPRASRLCTLPSSMAVLSCKENFLALDH
jgi:hypothetical protein